jgi:hypothetical protein
MKKKILKGAICAIAVSLLFSCATTAKGTSFQGVDAVNGSTLVITSGVTVSSFNGETVSWSGAPKLMGGQSLHVYVPAGLGTFMASAGLARRELGINFVAGKSYLLSLNLAKTDFLLEEMNR